MASPSSFCFLEMPSKNQAEKVVEILDGYKLDKAHIFAAMTMEVRDRD